MHKKGTYPENKTTPFLRGELGVCLILIVLLLTSPAFAQKKAINPDVVFTNLKKPTSLYVTQQHIFIVESGKNRVLKIDHSGKIIDTIGGLGNSDYSFDTPIDVDATNGLKIYISDYRNNRIQILDKRFQYLSTLRRYPNARSSRPIKPTHIAVNKLRELFFYDRDSNSIISINENGNKLDEFQIPNVIQQVDDIQIVGRNLYVLDLKSKLYHILADNGIQVRSFPLEGAIHLYVDKNGEEWLVSPSSISNSKETKDEIIFPEDIQVKDVFILDGVFYLLTNKSVLIVY